MVWNNMRLSIILNLKNQFDYEEFLSECKKQDADPIPLNKYMVEIGILKMAQSKFPNLKPQLAFSEMIKLREPLVPLASEAIASSPGCGSCGGGQVL